MATDVCLFNSYYLQNNLELCHICETIVGTYSVLASLPISPYHAWLVSGHITISCMVTVWPYHHIMHG